MQPKSGFTLIELLVVLALVMILSVAVVLALNPTETLKQARDSNRMNDLNTIKTALLVATAGTSTILALPSNTYCYAYVAPNCNNRFLGGGIPSITPSTAVDGTGWVPVDIRGLSAGSPIAALPLDPTNNSAQDLYYSFKSNGSQFELTATLESEKYSGKYGGNVNVASSSLYGTGTSLAL